MDHRKNKFSLISMLVVNFILFLGCGKKDFAAGENRQFSAVREFSAKPAPLKLFNSHNCLKKGIPAYGTNSPFFMLESATCGLDTLQFYFKNLGQVDGKRSLNLRTTDNQGNPFSLMVDRADGVLLIPYQDSHFEIVDEIDSKGRPYFWIYAGYSVEPETLVKKDDFCVALFSSGNGLIKRQMLTTRSIKGGDRSACVTFYPPGED